jgi:hypothetical protein
VRVDHPDIRADGHTKVQVLALGPTDETDASGPMVQLTVVPSSAGTIDSPTLSLGPVGATTYFTPCDGSAHPDCIETFQIAMTSADDPSVVLAMTSPLRTVSPGAIGSAVPCAGGGDRFHIEGDDYIYDGTLTVTQGIFTTDPVDDLPVLIHARVQPSDASQGLSYDLYFSSRQLNNPLEVQTYWDAERWPLESPGRPGLYVQADTRACNVITGGFQIQDLYVSGRVVHRLTATFLQRCEAGTTAVQGCIHVEQ